jgi:inward rectifier potassium channel
VTPPPPRVKLTNLSAVKVGVHRYAFDDPYYLVMALSWPAFLGAVLAVFLAANLFFATLYTLAPRAVANARPGSFVDAFFFSVETLATVGYGVMTPATAYGHAVATVEIFVGMFLTALATGAFFARFARPRPRLMFSNSAVIAPYEGGRALMLRVASRRLQGVSEVTGRISYLRQVLVDDRRYRRLTELPLVRSNLPVLSFSWTLIHPIDPDSPLYDLTPERIAREVPSLLVSITGFDEAISAPITDRKTYQPSDVRLDHTFVDIIRDLPDGFLEIDLTRLHDTEPWRPSAELTRADQEEAEISAS